MQVLFPLAALSLLATSFQAQTSDRSLALAQLQAEKKASVEAFEDGRNCPVELAARRSPESGLVQTKPNDRRHEQGLHLFFKSHDRSGIAQADLVVHGMAGSQVMLVDGASERHATEAFHVSPSAGTNRRYTSTVYLKRLTGVDYVELTTLTFADGSHWQSSPSSTCRVAPNGFKLVASGK